MDEPEDDYQRPESPFNALPPLVVILTLLILGIEAMFQLAENGFLGGPQGVGWRLEALEEFGFSPEVVNRLLINGQLTFDLAKRFFTYAFINVDLTQVAFCAALTLALGKFTAEYYGGVKVLVLYLLTAACGALAYGLLVEGRYPLLGGFTPVYGLIGAYTYALWLRLGSAGENQLLAFRLIGFLLLIQLIWGIVVGFMYEVAPPPTWIAELTGFVAGFLIAVVLAPGGWTTFVDRMRDRA